MILKAGKETIVSPQAVYTHLDAPNSKVFITRIDATVRRMSGDFALDFVVGSWKVFKMK